MAYGKIPGTANFKRPAEGQRVLNFCTACGEDFASLGTFDEHRIGEHEYRYDEGLLLDPPRYDGRRCLEVDEMLVMGWHQDPRGRWRQEAGEYHSDLAPRVDRVELEAI